MESLPSKPDKKELQTEGKSIHRYHLPATDSALRQLPEIDQGLINNDAGRKPEERRKRKKNRRKGERQRRVVLPGSILRKDEITKDWVEDGHESPKLYQLLPRLDLGVEEPESGPGEGDLGIGRGEGVTAQSQEPREEELHRVKKIRKFSEMTPRYVEHYKALLKKRLRHPDDLLTSPRGETEHYIKINTPRRPLIGRVKNDMLSDSTSKVTQPLENQEILLPALGKSSKRLLKPDQNTQKIREGILKMLDLSEGSAIPESTGIAVGDQNAEETGRSEDIHNKPWFCIVEDSTSNASAATTTKDKTTKESKPIERRVDDVIKEYEGNPGLLSKGATRKKLGAVVSPRRLGELLGCPSPIRMENRFNHYL